MTSLVTSLLLAGAPTEPLGALAGPSPGVPIGGLVVFMVVLIVGAGLLHRRLGAFGAARAEKSLRLLSSLPLGDKRAIVLVEAERQRMLVGVTGQSVQLICRLRATGAGPDALEAAGPERDGREEPVERRTFAALLDRTLGRGARP